MTTSEDQTYPKTLLKKGLAFSLKSNLPYTSSENFSSVFRIHYSVWWCRANKMSLEWKREGNSGNPSMQLICECMWVGGSQMCRTSGLIERGMEQNLLTHCHTAINWIYHHHITKHWIITALHQHLNPCPKTNDLHSLKRTIKTHYLRPSWLLLQLNSSKLSKMRN